MTEDAQLLGGRYRLNRRVGSGGMAWVYEGEDTQLHRRVAVKVLYPQFAGDDGFVRRFEHEATAAANLNHPGIAHVYDVGCDGDQRYIVMELAEGRAVKDLLRSGPFTPEDTINIGVQVAKALDYAHQSGVVHRDVKPHNILVSPGGEAKLVDFGIAVAEGDASITGAGSLLGTAHYVAPERARGEPATPSSDVYSLGVVLYEMATGRVPFDGETSMQIAAKQVSEQPIPPSRVNPRVPRGLERAILHAMEKDPARRPARAGDLARELLAYDEHLDQPTQYVPLPAQQSPPRRGAPAARSQVRPATVVVKTSPTWPLVLLAILAIVMVLGLVPLWVSILLSIAV